MDPIVPIPRHVAVVMDGNGRWARKRHLPRFFGHKAGVDALVRAIDLFAARGVEYLTVFAFSSENWRRPVEEVSLLMRLFVTALEREVAKMHANDIRLKVVGDLSRFDPKLQEMIANAERKTALELAVEGHFLDCTQILKDWAARHETASGLA